MFFSANRAPGSCQDPAAGRSAGRSFRKKKLRPEFFLPQISLMGIF
jgi:hypothetical protein